MEQLSYLHLFICYFITIATYFLVSYVFSNLHRREIIVTVLMIFNYFLWITIAGAIISKLIGFPLWTAI